MLDLIRPFQMKFGVPSVMSSSTFCFFRVNITLQYQNSGMLWDMTLNNWKLCLTSLFSIESWEMSRLKYSLLSC